MAMEQATAPALRVEDIELFDDRVLVEVDGGVEKSAGGILVPETARAKEAQSSIVGRVHKVGPGKIDEKTGVLIPMKVKPGTRVLFNTYAGTRATIDRKSMRIFHQHELLAYVPTR
jgi:chaperonin GroES